MSTTIYDSSLLTMRKKQRAESGEFINRAALNNTTTAKLNKPLGIYDQSVINDVRQGQMSFYRKGNGVYTVDNGCPCAVVQTNPIIPQ
jgi:hypothetical protein